LSGVGRRPLERRFFPGKRRAPAIDRLRVCLALGYLSDRFSDRRGTGEGLPGREPSLPPRSGPEPPTGAFLPPAPGPPSREGPPRLPPGAGGTARRPRASPGPASAPICFGVPDRSAQVLVTQRMTGALCAKDGFRSVTSRSLASARIAQALSTG